MSKHIWCLLFFISLFLVPVAFKKTKEAKKEKDLMDVDFIYADDSIEKNTVCVGTNGTRQLENCWTKKKSVCL